MNYIEKRLNLGKRVLLLCFLVFSVSASYADTFKLYQEDGTKDQEQGSSGSLFQTDDATQMTDEDSFNLYEDQTLKAPPGGGAPIGGVPVSDGAWVFLVLAGSYLCSKSLRLSRLMANVKNVKKNL